MTKQTDQTAERVAALERELAELKGALAGKEDKPEPKEPFKPEPYQPIDWTARMSMPPSALAAMVAAEPRGFMQGVVRDNRGPSTPTSMIPGSQQASSAGPANVAGSGTGWAREIPLGPSLHQRYVDQQIDAQDQRDRADLIRQHAQLDVAGKLSEQGEKLQKLAERLAERNVAPKKD